MAGNPRRFNGGQHVALYLAAGGRCARCGKPLEPGWHADHVQPYSKGGDTDVANGQALCPRCNQSKGGTLNNELRVWQEEGLRKFHEQSGNFLVVAAPGTGKTFLALTAAQQLLVSKQITRVIVVVHTTHLRSQWAKAAAELGIHLDHKFVNATVMLAPDMHGAVVTYATVASNPQLWRNLSTVESTLVILDEVHHCGDADHLEWGEAAKQAFELAYRRLLLSGTPNRSDRAPIPFVTYKPNGQFHADHEYSYGAAIQDHAVRPIEFLALDGQMRWREAGSAIVETNLADTDDDTVRHAIQAALSPAGDWITSVLRRADEELSRHRQETPDAGGLVIAFNQPEARAYATILNKICGEPVTLAISDEPDASAQIAGFRNSRSRWLVAVKMVSEGVDIPRLAVGVYATRTQSRVFFEQAVGRFVRTRGDDDETTATLLIPSVQPLLTYAKEIEKLVNEALREEERRLRQKPDDGQMSLRLNLVEPLDSSEAVHHSTILSGDSFTDEELRQAERLRDLYMPASTPVASVARLLRSAGAAPVVGTATIDLPAPSTRPLADTKMSLRRVLYKKVNVLHYATGEPRSHIYHRLNGTFTDDTTTATKETLEARLDLLDQWIDDTR